MLAYRCLAHLDSMDARAPATAMVRFMVKQAAIGCVDIPAPILEERIVNKAIGSLVAAVAAVALSGGAYAQSNNTLATPSTKSPAAVSSAPATSGYGAPGAVNSESGMGMGSQNSGMQNGMSNSAEPAYGVNNTLATPTTKSPVHY